MGVGKSRASLTHVPQRSLHTWCGDGDPGVLVCLADVWRWVMGESVERVARAMEPKLFRRLDAGCKRRDAAAIRNFNRVQRLVQAARKKAEAAINAMNPVLPAAAAAPHHVRTNEPRPLVVNDDMRIMPRRCGGWLAISGPTQSFKIGVFGNSESEAVDTFRTTLARWHEIYTGPPRAGVPLPVVPANG